MVGSRYCLEGCTRILPYKVYLAVVPKAIPVVGSRECYVLTFYLDYHGVEIIFDKFLVSFCFVLMINYNLRNSAVMVPP